MYERGLFMIKHDGHIHSPYCPHGTADTFADYCEQAISDGLSGITFTEHAPLPEGFTDPTPEQDSAMSYGQLTSYIEDLQAVKSFYKNKLSVLIGLEVDFIEGFEKETTTFLNEVGPKLDDSILSCHFININNEYYCIDYSPDVFLTCQTLLGSTDAVYKHYYETVKKSVKSDLGSYKPTRIGHITLCQKFKKKYPATELHSQDIISILQLINDHNYSLDYNGAGTLKPLCGVTYPPGDIASLAHQLGIPLIYGSDAHQVKGMAAGVDTLFDTDILSAPVLR